MKRPVIRRTLGFTLIELLIVIAIIAILAAILFPVFATAREKSRQTACASNEKQIALAFLQYAQDYDEFLPTTWSWEKNGVTPIPINSWDLAVAPYVGVKVADSSHINPTVFACPDDTIQRSASTTRSYAMPATNATGGGVVGLNIVTGPLGKYDPGLQLSSFPNVANLLLLVEMPYATNEFGNNSNDNTICAIDNASNTNCQDAGMPGSPYHSGGWNYAFCDGHVKWFEPQQTVGTGSPQVPKGYWSILASANM